MGRKQIPGLIKRGEIWHIDKVVRGRRICQSTGRTSVQEAEQELARLMEQARQAEIFGIRPDRTFDQAAARFIRDFAHKRSLRDDISRLKNLMPWIGHLPLKSLHMGALAPWIAHRKLEGVSPGTINHGLQLVRRIVNLAATEWFDAYGLTWLLTAPKIRMCPNPTKRQPYPLSWDEQARLIRELPTHLADMAIFAVNTGCRDGEICQLQWQWEVQVPTLKASVFIVPGAIVKNEQDRLVVMNETAKSVVERQRLKHPTHVFTYRGKPMTRMLNSAWLRARRHADLPGVRVHDLKHTFGRRLRAAGVSFEDRQDLLGHRSSRITTHYSATELSKLVYAVERVAVPESGAPDWVVLGGSLVGVIGEDSRKNPARSKAQRKEEGLTH